MLVSRGHESIPSDHCAVKDRRYALFGMMSRLIAQARDAVARMVSDVLSRNRDNPDFEISVLTCSITYM